MDHGYHLERLGVHLVHRPMPEGWWGVWDHIERTITVSHHLCAIQRRCTIYHELGHAAMGHTESTPRNELEADVWAARHLIDHEEWQHTIAAYQDALTVAHELSVIPRMVEVYAKHLARHPSIRHY